MSSAERMRGLADAGATTTEVPHPSVFCKGGNLSLQQRRRTAERMTGLGDAGATTNEVPNPSVFCKGGNSSPEQRRVTADSPGTDPPNLPAPKDSQSHRPKQSSPLAGSTSGRRPCCCLR